MRPPDFWQVQNRHPDNCFVGGGAGFVKYSPAEPYRRRNGSAIFLRVLFRQLLSNLTCFNLTQTGQFVIIGLMERNAYRIIDANFNRAREACRVVEEFCRFELNSSSLTGRAKQLRHELCTVISKLDALKLLAARDTLADVGVGQEVENQMARDRTVTITRRRGWHRASQDSRMVAQDGTGA